MPDFMPEHEDSTANVVRAKLALRQVMRVKRDHLFRGMRDAPQKLSETFFRNITLPQHACIAGYIAQRSEINLTHLLDNLRAKEYMIALPLVRARGMPLTFHRYEAHQPLIANTFGILEPDPSAPLAEPDILLVPLLAFDCAGRRLGYGGGYYDRTLEKIRKTRKVLAIGMAFSEQEVGRVPTTEYDEKLDKIVTESRVFSF